MNIASQKTTKYRAYHMLSYTVYDIHCNIEIYQLPSELYAYYMLTTAHQVHSRIFIPSFRKC